MDLKQLVVTSPVFAPLRRVERPGLALEVVWSCPSRASQLTVGLAGLQLRTGAGLMAANISQPLVRIERLGSSNSWASLLTTLNINIEKVEMRSKEVFAAACIGGAAENFLKMLKRKRISVGSLQLAGFQLSTDCPADQFYQKLLRAGQISPRSE